MSVDWLELSVKDIDVEVVFGLLAEHLGSVCDRSHAEVFRDEPKGFDAKGPLGLRVRADRVGQTNRDGRRRPWAGVRMTGEVCRAFGTRKVLAFAQAMAAAGDLKVSRVDIALDDFEKTFGPRTFAEACVAGDLDDEDAELGPRAITRVKRGNWEWNRRKGGCFWLGSRGGTRLLRVYDKDKESGGVIPSTRVELQSRDEFATELVRRMLAAVEAGQGIADVFLAHLVEFIDLREPIGPRSASHKWPRLEWWQAVVGEAKGIATPGRGDSGVWAWVEALRRQFGGALVVFLQAAGVDAATYRAAIYDPEAAHRVVSAVRAIVGRVLRPLSGEHKLRLEQLMRENGRKILGLPKLS